MASPVDTSVKIFRNDFPGAPVLNGVAGAAVALFTACLADGFGLRTASSLVVSGGVATMTLPTEAKNPNLLYSVVLVDGVTGALADLNGEQRILAATETTLQWATALADGTASGTITVKTAPAGWETKYSGTNKAAYRSLSPESLGVYLRVNDAGTTSCFVRGYEDMSDVDTGTGAFPMESEAANGWYWSKSSAANATANRWTLIANAKTLYFAPQSRSGSNTTYIGSFLYCFGDQKRFSPTDAFAAFITGGSAATNDNINGSITTYTLSSNNCRAPRSLSGTAGAVSMYTYPVSITGVNARSGNDGSMGKYPPASDGKLRLVQILLNEVYMNNSTTVVRGTVPGVYHATQDSLHLYFAPGDTINITGGGLGGRRMYTLYAGLYATDTLATTAGRIFIDITGPW